jgi:hypothetical protein
LRCGGLDKLVPYFAQIMDAPEGDRGRMVAINADKCALCSQTMHIFTAAYGAEAGVAALKWLPTGGALAHCLQYCFWLSRGWSLTLTVRSDLQACT